jgi:hypothetical protein
MKKTYSILNRLPNLSPAAQRSTLDAPRADGWFHLAPRGDFAGVLCNGAEERAITQRFDETAMQSIVANFHAPTLVDFEHRSMLPEGDTSAAAWIRALQIRKDGLWGQLELSGLGRSAIENKNYRHLSPAFDVEEIPGENAMVRPITLLSAGLTNRHNLKTLQPLTNSAAGNMPALPGRDGVSPSASQTQADQARKEAVMKEIAIALGLPETSGLPEVLAAIAEMKKTCDAAQTAGTAANARIVELEGAVLNKEADDFVAANSAKIKDPAAVKTQFVANKAATIALFASLADQPAPVPAPAATVHNRAAAKTPEAGAVVLDQAAAQRAAVTVIRNREKCNHKTAWNIARVEKPELFKEEAKAD